MLTKKEKQSKKADLIAEIIALHKELKCLFRELALKETVLEVLEMEKD